MAIPLIERLLDEADTNQAAAGVVALAADEGGVFYQGARGRIGPDVATPIALDSIFRIAGREDLNLRPLGPEPLMI